MRRHTQRFWHSRNRSGSGFARSTSDRFTINVFGLS
jgi:hypothetical protein